MSVVSVLTFFALGTAASQAQALSDTPQVSIGPISDVAINQLGSWKLESANGNITTPGTLAEARNGGDLLDVWRGTDNRVMLAFNNHSPFTIATTETFVSPAVTAFGSNAFVVAHTGVDSKIYYTFLSNNNNDGAPFGSTEWFPVPNQTTNTPVSLAQLGPNSNNVFMVYLGSNGNQQVWGTFFNGSDWQNSTNIGGGLALTEPAITYDVLAARLVVVAEGLDHAIWATVQSLGAPTWPSWTRLGGFTDLGVRIASENNDNVLISFVGTNLRPNYALFNSNLTQNGPTVEDITGFQTNLPVGLSSNSGTKIIALLTGIDGLARFDQIFDSKGF